MRLTCRGCTYCEADTKLREFTHCSECGLRVPVAVTGWCNACTRWRKGEHVLIDDPQTYLALYAAIVERARLDVTVLKAGRCPECDENAEHCARAFIATLREATYRSEGDVGALMGTVAAIAFDRAA